MHILFCFDAPEASGLFPDAFFSGAEIPRFPLACGRDLCYYYFRI